MTAPLSFGAIDPCLAGKEALERRDLPAAESALSKCIVAQPGRLEAHLMLAGVYQLQGKAEDLLRVALLGVKRFPAEPRFYLTAGTYAGRQKKFGEAIAVLEAGVKRWPADQKLRSLLASAQFGRGAELLNAADNVAAEKHLRRAAELAPDDVEAALNLGRALHNLHRGLDAVAVFDRLIAANPNLPLAHFHRGMARHGLGEFEAAVQDFTREIAINPSYPPSRLLRGLALTAHGEWPAALADFDAAAPAMPDDPRVHYGRARCLMQLGRTTGAEAALRRTIELDPQDPAPLNSLARLLLQTGRKDEARPLLEKAAGLSRRQRSAAPGEIEFAR